MGLLNEQGRSRIGCTAALRPVADSSARRPGSVRPLAVYMAAVPAAWTHDGPDRLQRVIDAVLATL
ncbi:hypothetical protein ACLMAL_19875 [Nocardia sp. CWNU-33]|uniref:hypothetical protein n=1 Tax=Nocardia sp. CWNU-33 TaxID=3392117 RepID=UPI00398F8003